MREYDLHLFVRFARMGDEKLEPFDSEERHVTAEDEIPFDGAIGSPGVLQRGDDAAEGAFAGPLIFDDFEVAVEVRVFLSAGDDRNV